MQKINILQTDSYNLNTVNILNASINEQDLEI